MTVVDEDVEIRYDSSTSTVFLRSASLTRLVQGNPNVDAYRIGTSEWKTIMRGSMQCSFVGILSDVPTSVEHFDGNQTMVLHSNAIGELLFTAHLTAVYV